MVHGKGFCFLRRYFLLLGEPFFTTTLEFPNFSRQTHIIWYGLNAFKDYKQAYKQTLAVLKGKII